MTDNVIPFADPNRDPVLDKLHQAHEDEAARLGVEFTNFGWASDENGICSKTTINPNAMQVSHSWITYEERARREEQQKRDMWERAGVRGIA